MINNQNNQTSEKLDEETTAKLEKKDTAKDENDKTIKFCIEDTISRQASSGED